ncbi:hypothetical protein GGR50DRAFT_668057 [Xylaria sp. CBS 124048]|nr:hypothetical protein GGR50DRAFT_668057 [Xylaria sp. CBS 124048]
MSTIYACLRSYSIRLFFVLVPPLHLTSPPRAAVSSVDVIPGESGVILSIRYQFPELYPTIWESESPFTMTDVIARDNPGRRKQMGK